MSHHDFDLPEDVARALGLPPTAPPSVSVHGESDEVPDGLVRWAARRRVTGVALERGWQFLCAPLVALRHVGDALRDAVDGLTFTRDPAALQVMFK